MRRRLVPLGIVLGAAALRLWRLGAVPPGFQFDEAHNAIDAARIVHGARPLFLPENGGREALLSYAHALLLGGLGLDHPVLALRLTSAFIGVLTVAAVLVGIGRWTGDRGLGRLAGASLAVMYAHVHFSRYGIRTIVAPLWAMIVVGVWWGVVGGVGDMPAAGGGGRAKVGKRVGGMGTEAGGHGGLPLRGVAWGGAVVVGVGLAAAAWSHPTGRLLPLILVGHVLWRAVVTRGRSVRGDVQALGIAGATAVVLFAPVGLYFLRHPEQFTGHASDVGLAAVAAAHHGGNLVAALGAQLAAVAGAFFVAGDPSTFHNLPFRPLLDPVTGLAFVIGVGIAAGALIGRGRWAARWREHAVLGAFWLVVGLVPTVLSDRAPNFSRSTAALPVIALLVALGLRAIARRVPPAAARDRARAGAIAAVIALSAAFTAHDYFRTFARDPQVYYSYDVEKLDALAALRARAAEASVYLAPVWATHATIDYLNRAAVEAAVDEATADFMEYVDDPAYAGRIIDASGEKGSSGEGSATTRIGQLDARRTIVYPDDGRDVVVAMPAREAEKTGWAEEVRGFLGDAPATSERVDDAQGNPLLELLRVPAAAFGDLAPPTDAPLEPVIWTQLRFGGAIELVGYTAGTARPGDALPLTLVWRALEPTPANLTVFVHLLGPDDINWGQDDREPGQASYRTMDWQGGEVIIDAYRPVLDDAAAGAVRLCLGWYDGATGTRLTTTDGQDAFCPRPIAIEGR